VRQQEVPDLEGQGRRLAASPRRLPGLPPAENPVVGKVFTYTFVERGGMGLEIECPYYQIDVLIPGVETIFKGYLVDRPEKLSIGDKVVAKFRTGKNATNTSLDVYWELAK
jgi:uncharacterized OB-fold protein